MYFLYINETLNHKNKLSFTYKLSLIYKINAYLFNQNTQSKCLKNQF